MKNNNSILITIVLGICILIGAWYFQVFTDYEAMWVIKNMPKCNPGKQNGTEVRAYYYVPVTFRLK